jgi:DMSO/TMAO reductase YedYZ molybdopterin-dependent catalytic subunit
MSEPEIIGDAATIKRLSAKRTRRSFLVGGTAAAAAYGAAYLINNSAPVGELQSGLRHVLNFDASVNRAVFGFRELAPTYSMRRARPLRLNGVIGLDQPLQLSSWRLQVAGVANPQSSPHYTPDVTAWQYQYGEADQGPSPLAPDFKSPPPDLKSAPKAGGAPQLSLADRFNQMAQAITHKRYQGSAEAGASSSALDIGTPGLLLSLDDLLQLPRTELITEFKCIEGWSMITHWSGVRLRDFIAAFPPAPIIENGRARLPRYVYMETPNGDYYCGYDMGAAMHPQSLLVTETFGQPLPPEHGAPLRLHMPIKYGYKQIKRIGLIAYTDTKPDDFWTKLGYDWFAGL